MHHIVQILKTLSDIPLLAAVAVRLQEANHPSEFPSAPKQMQPPAQAEQPRLALLTRAGKPLVEFTPHLFY